MSESWTLITRILLALSLLYPSPQCDIALKPNPLHPSSHLSFDLSLYTILMVFDKCAATLAVDEQLQNAGAEEFRKFER